MMETKAVIFDMDGLLIDSEPCWQEAGIETLHWFGVELTHAQYQLSTGLRTREWIDFWFHHFNLDFGFAAETEAVIIKKAIEKIARSGKPMPGVEYIFSFFRERNYKIGLATSSPFALIDIVTEKLNLGQLLDAVSSAESLAFSKPHPEVYLQCAGALGVSPLNCICFEDSFNGMIAVKAARMRCVVVPAPDQYELEKWGAADVRIRALPDFTESML